MKKMKRFLILVVFVFGVVFTTNGVFAFSLIPNSYQVFKIEISSSTEYEMLYGNNNEMFENFKPSLKNIIYINDVLLDFGYSSINHTNTQIRYFDNSTSLVGFRLNSNYTYEVQNGFILQAGDIIEIVNHVYANDLIISTKFDFDSGYLQYSFPGDSGPYVNFPKFPSNDVVLRYDFVNKLQQAVGWYNTKSITMYLPNQVIYEPHDTVYRVGYVAYSYNAFNQNTPIDIPSDIVAIRFVPDYSIINSAPYFRMYMLDIYGNIVNVFNQVTYDYVELYPLTMDFVLNIGYSEFTESYYNGYEVGKKDGELIGYDNGYRDSKERYGVWHQSVWYTGEQWGDIQYIAGFESTQDGGAWAVLWSAVLAPFALFEVELFGGVTIGMLALIPIVFGLIGFLFSLGGRKK